MYRCWAEINLNAITENLIWIRQRMGAFCKVMSIVKADAYGHGLKQISAHLMSLGGGLLDAVPDAFGVANLKEAADIRSVGAGWPILMLGDCLEDELATALMHKVMISISTFDEAKKFSDFAASKGEIGEVQIKVDTGMGRLGVQATDATELTKQVSMLPNLRLLGIYTHLAAAEDDADFTQKQISLFKDVVEKIKSFGIHLTYIHAFSSGGILLEDNSAFNTVRPGLISYGIVPEGSRKFPVSIQNALHPVLSFKSRVTYVKNIEKGKTISYGHTFTAPKTMKVATVSAGYGDGFPRAASNQGCVLIKGKKCNVLGRVTMDQTIVDVSEIEDVKNGDEVILIGKQGNLEITATDLAHWANTIPWEILTGITYRVQRIYHGTTAS